ncbi:MAG: lipid A biosynthesis acyltransferase [Hyphomicrobiaceae bacterium]
MDVVQPPMVVTKTGATPPDPDLPSRGPTVRQKLELSALRVAVALARRAPLSWCTATGAALAWTIGPWLRQSRRALANLELAFPDRPPAERRRIMRAMWANMGRTFAETLVVERIVADPRRIELVDAEHWQAQFAEPGPTIACTLHMGSWELAIQPLNRFGRKPVGVYKPIANPLVDRWLAETRAPLFPGGLIAKGEDDDTRSGQRAARQLIDLARKGGSIGLVIDHVDRRGMPIPFLGRSARFTTAPAMIARHVGARLWVGRCVRIGKESRFRMEIREVAVPRTQDKTADVRALTTAIFVIFEEWIRDCPEQWMWWNTRFVSPETAPDLATATEGAAAHSEVRGQ